MERKRKSGGRPSKLPEGSSRVSLGLKVTPKIKIALDQVAKDNGRTQSQEAELRLEQSFRDEHHLESILATIFGRTTAGIVLTLALGMDRAGKFALFFHDETIDDLDRWPHDPTGYHAAELVAVRILEILRPQGDPSEPRPAALSLDAFRKRIMEFDGAAPPIDRSMTESAMQLLGAEIIANAKRNLAAVAATESPEDHS